MGLTYTLGYHLSRLIARTLFRFRVYGREHIIEEGGAILAMNHESYLDPPLAGISSRRPIYYLARKTLLDWPIIGRRGVARANDHRRAACGENRAA